MENKPTKWTASEVLAFKDLKDASLEAFEIVADNKEWLINTPVEEAVKQGKIDKENKAAVFGYIYLRRMALVFDAFIALADE